MTLNKLQKKMYIFIRKMTDVESVCIDAQDVPLLRFYQFKSSTSHFFYDIYGRTDIRVKDTPHYAFASALAQNDPEKISQGEDFYRQYLHSSWGVCDVQKINQRIDDFRAHFKTYISGNSPSPVLSKMKEQLFVVDGNHRTAFAAALNQDIKACIWPADLAFMKFSGVDTFYGTDNKNIPYQSLYVDNDIVISGRRRDALERLKKIPSHVIENARILDVASNVGMSSIIAKSLGARECLGLEYTKKMVDISTRFAMFNGCYPSVQFRTFDVDMDSLPEDDKYDTAFMFSIHDHLKNPERLQILADKNVLKYVVFEGHPKAEEENYASFFKSGLFRSVTELTRLQASFFDERKNRPLWLCEKA